MNTEITTTSHTEEVDGEKEEEVGEEEGVQGHLDHALPQGSVAPQDDEWESSFINYQCSFISIYFLSPSTFYFHTVQNSICIIV